MTVTLYKKKSDYKNRTLVSGGVQNKWLDENIDKYINNGQWTTTVYWKFKSSLCNTCIMHIMYIYADILKLLIIHF